MKLLTIAFVLLLSSCGHVAGHRVTNTVYPEIDDCDTIDVYYTDTGDKKYKVIAVVNFDGSREITLDGYIRKIKREACYLGGQAIVLEHPKYEKFKLIPLTNKSGGQAAVIRYLK